MVVSFVKKSLCKNFDFIVTLKERVTSGVTTEIRDFNNFQKVKALKEIRIIIRRNDDQEPVAFMELGQGPSCSSYRLVSQSATL